MVLPPRLRSVGNKLKSGHFRDALQDLEPVYDPARDLDRLLMADIWFHTGHWDDAETLASDLTATQAVPAGIQGRAYELLTWLIKYKNGIPSALAFAEKSLQQAERANDLEQTCRAQLALLVAKADAFGPDSLGTLPADAQRNVMRSGDARLLSWLHIRLAEVEARRGRFDLTAHHLDLAAGRPQDDDDLLAIVQTHLLRGVVATYALHPERSMAHNRDALQCAREAGYHFGEVAALLNLGQLSLSVERFDEARGYLDEAEPLLGDRLPLAIGWTDTRAQLALALGDVGECQRLIARLAMLSEIDRTPKPSYGSLEATLTSVRLQRKLGDTGAALALLEGGVKEAQARRSPLLEATFLIHRADVLLDTGRPREALAALRDASRQSLGSFIALLAEAEQVRARAASTLGFPLLAEARLDRAERILTAIGRPGHVARPAPAPAPPSAPVAVAPGEAAPASAVREDRLLMLEATASLMELGGRPDLLAEELFMLCRRAMPEGPLALVSCESDGRHVRLGLNWTRPLVSDDGAREAEEGVVRLTVGRRDLDGTFEILADAAAQPAAEPMLDALRMLVDAACRLDAARETTTQAAAGAPFVASVSASASASTRADAAPAARTGDVTVTGAGGRALFSGALMKDLLRQAHRIGRTDLTVLVAGETGVGKEIFADEIRRVSPRQWNRFAKIDCSSIPRELLEGSPFAHAQPPHAQIPHAQIQSSGAEKEALGAIRAANHGTVLLDEIGELSLDKQVALLRLLDAKEVHPLGADRSMALDVRFIFVTNANLERLVHERRFREDLFHRINVVVLRIPPLRDRRDEILPLARHFLTFFSTRHQRPAPSLSDDAAEALLLHGWPGNVRELRNEMERLIGLLDPEVTVIRAEALGDSVREGRNGAPVTLAGPNEVVIRADQPLRLAVDELEREIIARRIRDSQGNLDRIAAGLGLSRKGLYFKRQRHGLL
jgi:two-component system NtrC family response regulator